MITLIDAGKCKEDVTKMEIPAMPKEDEEGGAGGQRAAANATAGAEVGKNKLNKHQPQMLVVNKADLVKNKAGYVEHVLMESLKPDNNLPMFEQSFFVSALTGGGVRREGNIYKITMNTFTQYCQDTFSGGLHFW